MSTEQEDAVLLLQLEEKITRRIRSQIRSMVDGSSSSAQLNDVLLDPATMQIALVQNIKSALLNDSYFVTELTKRIGQRMSQIY